MDLTQQALADCAGCSLVTIRKFEADERRPSLRLAERLAECLAVPTAERELLVSFARRPEAAMAGALQPAPSLAAGLSPPATAPLPEPAPPVIRPQPLVRLPAPLTELIGREMDLAAISGLIFQPHVRVITLTGAGGTGKTRLAIEVARRLAKDFPDLYPDGSLFIDLSSLADPELLVATLIEVFAISDTAGRPVDAVKTFLRPKRMLLVLDNFEQIADATGDLTEILLAAGGVTVLITSRIVLHIYGEHEYPVAPLAVPETSVAMTPDELLTYPAIALFVERGRAVRPGFALTMENAADVRRLCARLDGLPLAIELAAARLKLLQPAALLSQLATSLDLAARQRQTGERQQTMRATIDWSYRLLNPAEQQLFRALGVFTGAFGLPEVGAILGRSPDAGDLDLLDELAGLVEKSMIRLMETADQPRFRLLFVLREYALEQLDDAGETSHYRTAHLDHYRSLALELGPRMTALHNESARSELAAAVDDLRAALHWAFAHPDRVESGLQIAIALADFWIQRGMTMEGQNWVQQGLRLLPASARFSRARALVVAGRLAYYQSNFAEAVSSGREALELLAGETGEEAARWTIIAHRVVGNSAAHRGDFDESLRHQYGILDIYRQRADNTGVAQTLQALGLTLLDMGQLETAAEQLAESVSLLRIYGGDADDLLFSLNGLGIVELVRGRYDAARPALEESLTQARNLDTPLWQAMALINIGHLDIPLGRFAEARGLFVAGQHLARETNGRQFTFQADLGLATLGLLEGEPPAVVWPHLADCLEYHREQGRTPMRFLRLSDVLALYCARSEQPALAAQLLSRAAALREQPAMPPRYANVQPVHERVMALLRERLQPGEIEQATRTGAAASEEDLLRAVEEVTRTRHDHI
jgi:predicted ATPase